MKILHIIDNIWLWWAQSIVKWIFEKQKDNKDIYLYSLRKTVINIKINHENVYWSNSNSILSFPIFKLRKFIKNNNIEILHCHLPKSQVVCWLLKIIFFPETKLIFHEHWSIFQDWKFYLFLLKLFKSKVDLFIAISNATKKYLKIKVNIVENKIELLYNFVDLDRFSLDNKFNLELERKKYLLNKNDFTVWFAWRLIDWKWWDVFINSAIDLIDKWYNIKFLIAWDWYDKLKLLKYINWYSNIKYIWYIEDMNNFYWILDIFIIPSYWEPMWLTEIEAMSVWVPVISSNVEALNEIIEDWYNWLLFNVKDSNDLSNNILKLYNDLELRKKLIKNWKKSVKRYNLDNYLVELEKIYEKVN